MSDTKKRLLGRQGFTVLVALFTSAASFLLAELMGPIPLYVGIRETSVVAPSLYLAGAALPFGILLAEAVIDFRLYGWRVHGFVVLVVLVLLGLMSMVRFVMPLPLSGHGLIVAYFLLHELAERREGRSWKLAVGSLILIQAAWYKLFLWSDPASLLTGICLGVLAWAAERALILLAERPTP
jgi:hypothetical protein